MKTIATNITDNEFELFEKRVDELGISKSDYIKQLVFDDIGIEHRILKPVQSYGILDRLKKAFGVDEIDVTEQKSTQKEPKKEFLRYRDPNSIWKPSSTVRKNNSNLNEREYLFNYKTGLIEYKSQNNIWYKSCSLNELLVIDECKPILRKDVISLRKFLKKHPSDNSFSGVIFQYQNGVFDEIINNFKNNVLNCEFKVYSNNIWIMDVKSTITSGTANELISIIENNGFSEKLVYNLCKSYPYCNEIDIRIICENYKNPQLLCWLKQRKNTPVLNDPSKRRNFIRNNGCI